MNPDDNHHSVIMFSRSSSRRGSSRSARGVDDDFFFETPPRVGGDYDSPRKSGSGGRRSSNRDDSHRKSFSHSLQSPPRRASRRASLDGGDHHHLRHSMPAVRRSNSDGFNIPLPFQPSEEEHSYDHHERSRSEKIGYKPQRRKSSSRREKEHDHQDVSPRHRHSHRGSLHRSNSRDEHRQSRRHSSFTVGNSDRDLVGEERSERSSHRSRKVEKQNSQEEVENKPSASQIEKSLHHYAVNLRLPTGFITSIIDEYNSIDSRLWVMENSSSMRTKDAHRAKIDSKLEKIIREDGHSRWAELTQIVDFHVKMSARCWIPTKFWLVNDPGSSIGPQRFGVAWGSQPVRKERELALDMMGRMRLDQDTNHLTRQLRKIERRVREDAPRLLAANKKVSIIICTGGRPTDQFGKKGSAVMKEFVDCMVGLSKLPVKIVVRLCTDDERASSFFNKMDGQVESMDVLDDYWGEAMEVFLHNPWLNYSYGIHTIREAGLASDIIDDLDEKAFTAHDVHQFCKEFFIGDKDIDLPHPRNWDAFMRGLKLLLKSEKLQWNPMKKKLLPWIDFETLERMFGGPKAGKEPPEESSANFGQPTHRPHSQTRAQAQAPTNTPASNNGSDMTLEQMIMRWSHKDNKTMNSLQDLLVNVPTIFPPTNTKVESHDYFSKWKVFSAEAFSSTDSDELGELLKRAVRKTKFFLHPDKLPKDLTDNQTLLLKTIWDVIQEQEEKTLNN